MTNESPQTMEELKEYFGKDWNQIWAKDIDELDKYSNWVFSQFGIDYCEALDKVIEWKSAS